MKKIFSILLIMFVSLISVFAFTRKVYADNTITAKYSDFIFTIDKEKGTVDVSGRGGKVEHVDYELHVTSASMLYNGTCRSGIWVATVPSGKGVTYKIYSSSTSGGNKIDLTYCSIPDCKNFEGIKNKYLSRITEINNYVSEIETNSNNSNSCITKGNGISYSAVAQDNASCDKLKNYTSYYFNTLNPIVKDDVTKAVFISEKISSLIVDIKDDNVCKTDDYYKFINDLENKRAEIDSFYKAGLYECKRISKLIIDNKCENLNPDELCESIKNDLYETDKNKEKTIIGDMEFKFQDGCSIIGGDFKEFLNTILFYIKIIAIVLAVILSLLDYIKAASGSDDKPMTKANNNFITRLILVIVLFLLPVILTFLLNVLHINNVTGDSIQCLDVEK